MARACRSTTSAHSTLSGLAGWSCRAADALVAALASHRRGTARTDALAIRRVLGDRDSACPAKVRRLTRTRIETIGIAAAAAAAAGDQDDHAEEWAGRRGQGEVLRSDDGGRSSLSTRGPGVGAPLPQEEVQIDDAQALEIRHARDRLGKAPRSAPVELVARTSVAAPRLQPHHRARGHPVARELRDDVAENDLVCLTGLPRRGELAVDQGSALRDAGARRWVCRGDEYRLGLAPHERLRAAEIVERLAARAEAVRLLELPHELRGAAR